MQLTRIRSKFATMKKRFNILIALSALVTILCSCGDDRSNEFYTMTQENQWIYSTMKEVYLWSGSIGEVDQKTFFSTPQQFFKKLLTTTDKTSFFSDATEITNYGIKCTLLRDPLGFYPSRISALIEYIEPNSVASAAGLQRGMWVSEINGDRLTTSSANKLMGGDEIELTIQTIEYDDENNAYYWENHGQITVPAATRYNITAVPVATTLDEITEKNGYLLINTFDGEDAVAAINNEIATLADENINNIIIDLRYNNSTSITDAAKVAAIFIPAEKHGTNFCTLSKTLNEENENTTAETFAIPASNVNISNKPLYIITTARTEGIINTFIKSIQSTRIANDVKIIGETAKGSNFYTECYASPYAFNINPVTAYINDAGGAPLIATLPDYAVKEYESYYPVYPLGSKQEHLLFATSYVIANGTLPPTE